MGTYFHTCLRMERDTVPVDAVARVLGVLRSAPEESRFARVQFREGFSWLRVEHLGFFSLKQTGRTATVLALAQEFREEAVMLAAQTTAGCAAFGHYVGGALRRFLSAGDDRWFEINGHPEPWESDLFSKQFPWEYRVGGGSPFHDGTLRRIASYYGLPGLDVQTRWHIDRGLSDEQAGG